MKKLLRASFLAITLSFSGVTFAVPVHAAATNDILKFYTDGSLTNYQAQCAEIIKTQTEATKNETDGRKKIGSSQCTKTFGTVETFCRAEAINLQGDLNCTFTAPDKSKVVGNPHFALGEVTKNYNSEGGLVSSVEKGGANDGETTGTPPASGGLSPAGSGVCDNSIGCTIAKLPGMLMTAIGFLLLTLSGLLLGVAGVVFNWVVIRTVFQFALYFGTSPGMLVAWGVLRDIANIALLFGFIFMGIATILNTQSMEGYTAKKALPRLIIFAVLLNFSLFATQAIIDVSNGFSSVFASYAGERCDTNTSTAGASSGETNEKCSNVGISGKIISAAGLSKVFPSGFSESFDKPYTYAVMLIILSLLVTVAAMVLFAAAIMLVIRVVVLSLLMVTSPIGFAGMAIPALHKISRDWWDKLINQAFFAPLYLLMIFISLKLVDGLQEGNASIADALMGNTASSKSVMAAATTAGNMQVIVVFIIVIGFMVAALMVAQKMGAYGAGFATKSAAAVTFGAHGFVARRTVGRASAAVAHTIRSSSFGDTNLGKTFAGVADKGASASYSTRNLVGGALKGTGLDFGKANKDAGHGYHGIEEKAIKARVEYAKTLKGRMESGDEYRTRIQTEQKALDIEREAATNAIPIAETNVANAQSAATIATASRDAKQRERDSISLHLADQKAQVARNPADSEAQIQLQDLQDQLVKADRELAQSEQGVVSAEQSLVSATNDLAAANKAEVEAYQKTVDTAQKELSSKEQQTRYAKNIEHERDFGTTPHGRVGKLVTGFSLASHANHAAHGKIIKEAGKSDTERMLEKLAEKAKEEKNNHGPDTSHAPKAKSGGGDPHAH